MAMGGAGSGPDSALGRSVEVNAEDGSSSVLGTDTGVAAPSQSPAAGGLSPCVPQLGPAFPIPGILLVTDTQHQQGQSSASPLAELRFPFQPQSNGDLSPASYHAPNTAHLASYRSLCAGAGLDLRE
ncbi:hypothetical protein KIL84_002555 [Mauremys mutica]|uniref:Uncharacterized protein n=1 Tax=Mauremys mutica TaxID=74926 RepID=A0A9D3X722_9SAUR|nr:hypothetical protein KIL84_002555 [Mauremys mutica]